MIWLWGMLACAPSLQDCSAAGTGLGTTWRARWRAEACDPAVGAALQARLDAVEAHVGLFAPDSELAALRSTAGPVPVGEGTALLVREALTLAAQTEGAFDPTIEPLARAWGLHDDPPALREPPEAARAAALALVGWQRVRVGRDADGPWVDAGDTALDLGAVMEGHAADRLAALLASRGLVDHLVDVGGAVSAAGRGPEGPWRVGLVAPDGVERLAAVRPGRGGVAWAVAGPVDPGRPAGVRLDPTTGGLAESDVAAVTVVAPEARQADGLATAVVLIGAERGLALLEALPDVEGEVWTVGDVQARETTGMGGMRVE